MVSFDDLIDYIISKSHTRFCGRNPNEQGFYGHLRFCYTLLNCPECTAVKRKKVQAKYEEETPEESRSRDALYKLLDKIAYPMKADPHTKHFACKRCGLYATREQVSDIRIRLNRREKTRQDLQDDYLEWWQKSKKEKNR